VEAEVEHPIKPFCCNICGSILGEVYYTDDLGTRLRPYRTARSAEEGLHSNYPNPDIYAADAVLDGCVFCSKCGCRNKFYPSEDTLLKFVGIYEKRKANGRQFR
jgi:hypothetical protein